MLAVLRLIGLCTEREPWYIVTELAEYGDLRQMLLDCKASSCTLTVAELLKILTQVALGMSYLHSKKVVYLVLSQH